MAGHHCIAILCLLAVTVSAQDPNELVNCYANDNCGGTPSGQGVTREACCSNLLDPVGFSVQSDLEGCEQCPIVIGFSPDDFTGIEQGEGHSVMAGYLSGRPRTGGSLNLQLITGSGATEEDVRIDTRVRVFNNLPLSTIMITLVLDGVSQEVNETFSIEYLDPPLDNTNFFPVGVPVTVGHLNGTILDRDSINFQLSEDDYFQQEEPNAMLEVLILKDQGIRLANPVRFRISPLTVPEAEARGIVVNFSRPGVDDTPISPIRANTNDFNATISEVTLRSDEGLPVGDTGVTVFIPIVDDAIDEAQSQFFIAFLEILNATNFDLITVSRTTSTCIIDDNDGTRIGYAQAVYSFSEPDFETLIQEVTLIREGGTLSEQAFFVAISVGDPGGTTRSATLEADDPDNSDYRIGSTTNFIVLPFPAAAESITFNFFLYADELPEGLEAFRATSTPAVGSPTFQPPIQPPIMGGAFQFTEIQIIDNDPATVGFMQPNYTINETGVSQEVCVQVFIPNQDEELIFNMFLVYRTRTGTADGSDFGETAGVLAIIAAMSDGMPRVQCFDISITDDMLYEDVESFTVTLELDTFEMQSGIIITPNVTTIFIEDNDAVVIGFIDAPYEASENDSFATVTFGVVNGITLQIEICVELSFSLGTAINGSDYSVVAVLKFVFSFSIISFTFDLTLINDDVFEITETLSASLSFSGGDAPPRASIAPETAQINILDDDLLVFSFVPAEYEFREDAGDVSLSVSLVQGDVGEFTVGVIAATDDNSTAATADADSDYESVEAAELTYSSGSGASQSFLVTINTDDLTELRELFEAVLTGFTVSDSGGLLFSLSQQESGRIRLLIRRAQVFIVDINIARIGFEPVVYNVSEGAGEVFFMFSVLEGNIAFSVNILFFTSDGSATGGPGLDFDFNSVSTEFAITGTGSVSAPVNITDDQESEGPENFFGNIAAGSGAENFTNIMFDPILATANIIDNDDITIGFVPDAYEVNETDGTVTFFVQIIEGQLIGREIIVEFSTEGGSAEAGQDYAETVTLLTFRPGDLRLPVSVMVIDDDLSELDETFFGNLGLPAGSTDLVEFRPGRANVTILDTDVAVIGFLQAYNVIEGVNTSVTVDIGLLSGALGRSVEVTVFTADDTALATSDYSQVSQTFTFSQTDIQFSIIVPILNDLILEQTERFFARAELVNPADAAGVSINPDETTVTIEDNDNVVIGFVPDAYTVDENAGSVNFTIEIISGTLAFDVVVEFFTEDGSAQAPGDYTGSVISLTFGPGTTSLEVSVPVIDDDLLEDIEMFFGNLRFPTGGEVAMIEFSPSMASATITDNDEAVIGFLQDYIVREGVNDTVNVDIQLLSGQLGRNVEVRVFAVNGSAQSPDDFIEDAQIFTFSPMDIMFSLSLRITDDTILEATEMFSVQAVVVTAGVTGLTILPDRSDVTIEDDDVARIGFVQNYVVTEGVNNTVSVEIQLLEGELGRTVEVLVFTANGSAQAPGDYTESTQTFTFSLTDTEFTTTVSIGNDAILEQTEQFFVRAELLSIDATGVSIDPDESVVTILDDDAVVIGFVPDAYTVDENAGSVNFTIEIISGTLAFDVIVEFFTEDGSAQAPDDYTGSVISLTFGPGTTSLEVSVPVINDDLLEDIEMFFGNLRFPAGGEVPMIEFSPSMASATITDDDVAIIGFLQDYNVTEGVENIVSVDIQLLSGQLQRLVVVRVFTVDGSALDPGDYTQNSQLFTFSASAPTQFSLNVLITNDDILEATEMFSVRAELITTNATGVTINPDQSDVTILDEDTAVIGFLQDYEVTEGINLTVNVDIQLLSGELGRDVVVRVFTVPGTALSPGDYITHSEFFTFSPTQTEFAATIIIVNDAILEPQESFTVEAELVSTDAPGVQISPDQSTVTINDDERVTIGFNTDAYSILEGERLVNVTIVLTGRTDRELTVILNTRDGTARSIGGSGGEMDFLAITALPIVFPASPNVMMQQQVVQIRVIDDMFVENDENLTSIVALSVSDPAVDLNPGEASVTIRNDDAVVIGFDQTMYEFQENAGFAIISISILQGELRIQLVVTLSFADGTAIDGNDYNNPGTLTFIFDQDTVTHQVMIPLIDNDIHELDENFFASLASDEDPNILSLNPRNATITILDDEEVSFTFRQPMYVFMENVMTAIVNVDRNGLTDLTFILSVTGPLQTETGRLIDQTITFGPNDVEVILAFSVEDDLIALEPTETLNWRLDLVSMFDRASVSPFNSTTILIVDDDELVLSLNKSGQVPESQNGEACISFSNAFATDFSINAMPSMPINVTIPDAATPGVDYTAPPPVLQAVAGTHGPDMALCFDVPIVDDDFVEFEECFGVSISLGNETADLLLSIADGQASALCCIQDDDRIVVGFDEIEYNVDEPSGSLTITVSVLQGTLMRPAEVTFFSTDGTATSTGVVDFVDLGNVVLQFDENTLTRPIIISIVDDSILEDTEFFFGNLNTSDGSVDLLPDTTTVNILEIGDEVTVGFNPETYMVNEVDGVVTLIVEVLEGTLERSVQVLFETSPGQATATAPADYERTTAILIFSASVLSISVPVTIFNDTIVEGDETFFGLLDGSGQPVITDPTTATVVIAEDTSDRVTIGFEETLFLSEEGSVVQVCVRILDGSLERDVLVDITSSDGTAAVGEDYVGIAQQLTFTMDEDRRCVNVSLLSDDILELPENLFLDLDTDDPMVILEPEQAEIIVNDTSRITVALEETFFPVNEEDGAIIEVCVVVTEGELARDAVVRLRTTDGTATSVGDADFVAENVEITFSSALTRMCVNVSVLNDEIYEDPEQFFVGLDTEDPSVDIDPSRQTGTAEISDDDEVIIGFVDEEATVLEEDPSTEICAQVQNNIMLERTVVVTFSTADAGGDRSATSGEDYVATTASLTFAPGNDTIPHCVTVLLIGDDSTEGAEFFHGELMTDEERVLLAPQQTNITILDNEVLRIGFIMEPYMGRERDGFITLVVQVAGILERELLVNLATEDLPIPEAVDGDDYTGLNTVLTFGPAVTTISVNVTLLDDDLTEGAEQFQARLTLITPGGSVVFFPSDIAPATILEEERVVIGMEETVVTVPEDIGERQLCASVMSGVLGKEVVVMVIYENRNAVDGEDFIANPISLTFGPSMMRNCFNVTILDDQRYELREDFFVNISTSDPDTDIRPTTTIVMIVDEDMIVLGWEFPVYNTSESSGTVELCAVLVGDVTLAATLPIINLLTADGTATSVQDYGSNLNPNTFEFLPGGVTRLCTMATITDDDELEDSPEFFEAVLSLIPTERVTVNPARARVQIFDDDTVVIGFDPSAYTVNEDAGVVTLEVAVLTGTLDTEIVIRLTTSDGSAISSGADPDFEAADILLTFSPSNGRSMINITIIDDQLDEPNEVFSADLELVTDNDRVQVSPDMAQVEIVDNDVPTIGFERTTYLVPENDSVVTEICAVLMPPPALAEGVTIMVTITFMDGTAQSPEDFDEPMSTLTFNSDTSRSCVDFTALEDDVVEGQENLTAVLTSGDDVTLLPDEAVINILETEVVRVMFDLPEYTFNEDDGQGSVRLLKSDSVSESFMVRVTGGPSVQTDVEVSAAGIDTVVTFGAGPSAPNFIDITFAITDDEVGLEAVEMYTVTFEILTLTNVVQPGMLLETKVNILDNDPVDVGFEQPNITVNETDGNITVCVVKNRVTSVPVTVTICTIAGTATSGTDFDPDRVTTTVTIPGGDTMACFDSDTVIDDNEALEGDETFMLQIKEVDPPGVNITNGSTTVIILDDDMVTVTFEEPVYNATELSGVAMVCLIKNPETADSITIDDITTSPGTATAGDDYTPGPFSVTFGPGANNRQCINIPLLADTIAEPTEDFTVSLNLPSATNPMVFPGTIPSAVVNIIDSRDRQTVNDTVIGDPLFTVPILVSEEQLAALNLTRVSLCYEIHGSSDQWFNLVTDECATVNAQYFSLSRSLNVIDEIGVRAVDNSDQCVNIRVNVNNCTAEVNDVSLDLMERYSRNGINVRRYNNRVRISVPNCNELTLVMWAICEMRTLDNPDVPDTKLTGKMIKYVVMRGLNFGHREAHGLLGQFWNIPVEVTPFTGQLRDGSQAQGRFILNMTSLDVPRAYTGWLYDLTWEFQEGPCLYVGNRQGGPIYEVTDPNEGIIENIYKDYMVDSAFSEENYIFGLFSEDRCVDVGSGLPDSTPTNGGPLFPNN